MIKQIQKRNGKITDFKIEKITNAIFKALQEVGEANLDLAADLARKAAEKLEETFGENALVKVEQAQDVVEQVLVEGGHAKVAKAYILYRQKRAEIRRQKEQILRKAEIDETDKKFDLNALKVLASRYLRKDSSGNIIESPSELFSRVSVHSVLPSLLYDERVFQKQGATFHRNEEFDAKETQKSGKCRIGKYLLNEFHLDGLKRLYDRLNRENKMKLSFNSVLKMLEKGDFENYEKEINDYYNLMVERKFLPNTPALVNFGNSLGMGSACFAVDVGDSIEEIMEALKKSAIIFKSGGGVGYNFSKLRPEGDFIKSTCGVSSGPLHFMALFDKMTDVIKQGGVRRGASMGIMNVDYPDIEKFVVAKRGNQALTNFNISVLFKADFWEHYEQKKPYPLRNPRTGEIVKYIDPQNLFNLIVYQVWESGEPGILFEDKINEFNPFLKTLGPIQCTNPCSELPLYPSESCNLGSVNVRAFCKTKQANGRKKETEFDWREFERVVKIATRFLDNISDINKYPLPDIEEATLNTRKLGLGLMGVADALYELEIPYNSARGLETMEKMMEFLNYHSKMVSVGLAQERGAFPYFEKSFYTEGRLPFRGREKESGELPLEEKEEIKLDWDGLKEKIKKHGIRNSQTTTNAPTGTISMIAGVSSGIEPNFSLVFEKKVVLGTFYYVNPIFEKVMAAEGLLDEDLIKEVCENQGSVQKIAYIPSKLKKLFVVALDLTPRDHIKALSVLQRWTDSSISKTTNFPSSATVDDMKETYLLAYKLNCKGVTAFRDKSIAGVMNAGVRDGKKPKTEGELVSMKDEKATGGPVIYHDINLEQAPPSKDLSNGNGNSGLCPKCSGVLIKTEGCKKCPSCGWGLCV
ncbi:MAG: adenosylcobalamin-dependent ribonucleoside-diphosphate reductase [Patescibacteria group bacterium]|nr:adenosylcobalamin-dependent ribonucleoside-diphosphate reductase [Patescibacteria group bacterium]